MGEEQGSEDARSRSQSSCPARVFQTPWGQLLGCRLTRQVAQTGQGPELWPRMQPLSSPLKSPLAASGWLLLKGGPPDPCFTSAQSTIPGPLPAHRLQITSLNILSPETRASSHETMKVGPPPHLPAQEQPLLGPSGKHRKEVGQGTNPACLPPDRLFTDCPPGLSETWSTNHQCWQLGPNTLPLAPCYNQRPVKGAATLRALLSDSYSLSTKQTHTRPRGILLDHCENHGPPLRQRQQGKLFINALGAKGATGK